MNAESVPVGEPASPRPPEQAPVAKDSPQRRREAHYAVTRVLSKAASIGEAAPRILGAVGESLGWDVGAIWTIDRGVLRCVDVWKAAGLNVPEFEAVTREMTFPPGVGLPGRVWSTGAAAWIEDVVRDDNFPRAPMAAAEGLHGAFAFPISSGAGVLGVVETFSREVREPDGDLLEMMAAIGAQIGLFIQHREAEASIRASEQRFAFLAEAGALLAASLNYERTLAKVARLGVPDLADWCAVDVLEADGTIRRLAIAHMDPAKMALANRMRRRYPPEDAGAGLGKVLRTGRSELYPEIAPDSLETIALDDEHLKILRSLGLTSGMWVPLTARGRTLGAITFASSDSGRVYGAADLSLAEELGRLAGVAVDNARLYEERSRIARTLQRSLLPPRLPEIPGIEVAARYRAAAGEGNEVGGDFYDVFEVGKRAWAIMIGDVCGKGADAAAITGLARHTLRTAAMSEWRPRRILVILNDALVRNETDEYCTVAFARLSSMGKRVRVTLACGGHPPPLFLGADGTVEAAGRPGTLLGVFPDPEFATAVLDLQPGDALLFYTDGVTESRPGVGLSEAALRDLLMSRAGDSAEKLADAVERAAVEAQPEGPRDDIAIVCVRVTG